MFSVCSPVDFCALSHSSCLWLWLFCDMNEWMCPDDSPQNLRQVNYSRALMTCTSTLWWIINCHHFSLAPQYLPRISITSPHILGPKIVYCCTVLLFKLPWRFTRNSFIPFLELITGLHFIIKSLHNNVFMIAMHFQGVPQNQITSYILVNIPRYPGISRTMGVKATTAWKASLRTLIQDLQIPIQENDDELVCVRGLVRITIHRSV